MKKSRIPLGILVIPLGIAIFIFGCVLSVRNASIQLPGLHINGYSLGGDLYTEIFNAAYKASEHFRALTQEEGVILEGILDELFDIVGVMIMALGAFVCHKAAMRVAAFRRARGKELFDAEQE